LSGLGIRYIESWQGFLRENYYVGGSVKNNEIELVAYEAGHAVSSIPWAVSTLIETLEHDRRISAQDVAAISTTMPDLKCMQDYYDTWATIFKKRSLVHVQHQIAGLSTTLDEAYYRITGKTPPPEGVDVLLPLDQDLPSQTSYAIKHSLDYWERTVEWLGGTVGQNWQLFELKQEIVANPNTCDPSQNRQTTISTQIEPVGRSIYGAEVTIRAIITPVEEGKLIPKGYVVFSANAVPLGVAALDEKGVAVLTTSTLNVGSHAIEMVYSGDENYVPVNSVKAGSHNVETAAAGLPAPAVSTTTSQPKVPFLTPHMSRTLGVALIEQGDLWESLLTYQQQLRNLTGDNVTQKIINDFMDDFEAVTSTELVRDSRLTLRRLGSTLAVAALIVVMVVLGLIVILKLLPDSFLASDMKNLLVVILAAGAGGSGFAIKGNVSNAAATNTANTPTPAEARPAARNGIFGSAETAVFAAFDRGYRQIRIEFSYLNNYVAAASPLVEFFIWNFTDQAAHVISNALEQSAGRNIPTTKQPGGADIVTTTSTTTTTKATPKQRRWSLRKPKNANLDLPSLTIRSSYDFLTQIIWTAEERDTEIKHVARAAFGPIGGFVGAHLKTPDKDKQAK
jgi:hypothetical protein